MATRKVDKHTLYATDQEALVIESPTVDTTGLTITVLFFTEAQAQAGTTGTVVGTDDGGAAGVDLTIALSLSALTAGRWYSMRAFADLGGASEMGVLPNPNTADEILVYLRPVPTVA